MSRRKTAPTTLALAALAALAVLAPGAGAAPAAPAWQISLNSHPTNFKPGELSGQSNYPEYAVIAENVGAASTTEPITITVQLPEGISPSATQAPSADHQAFYEGGISCSVAGQSATCIDTNVVDPGEWVKMTVPVDVDDLSDPTALGALAKISSGAASATTTTQTTISNSLAPLGLLEGREGFNSSATEGDGTPATEAGAHPQQLNVNVGLPTQRLAVGGAPPQPDGTLHDTKVDLPPGMVVDPSATPKCPAALFQTFSCPDSTQIGIADVPTGGPQIGPEASQIYNLEPPPGRAAAFGFYVLYVPVTILGSVRSDEVPGSYRITSLTAAAPSILAVFDARIQLWGSPSDESHDKVRGECRGRRATDPLACPVSRTDEPLLGLPTSCTDSMQAEAHVDLWEDVGHFFDRAALLEDSNGNTMPVTSCNQLQFDPTLQARPTTSAADSPTGLEAILHIPQTDSVGSLATPHLRKAVVTLPKGVAVNPSSANGLEGCTSAQIGIDPGTGTPSGDPVRCPNASRIGSVEVDTPLLDHPLPGSVFVATPHDNPFDSLLAIYVVVDDPISGTLIKLAGHVVADPQTGQLTTTFDNNPQLPFSDFKLDFFGGATAALRTPATCGSYATTSQLTPWSAPDSGPPATTKDSWSITQSPSGSCTTSEASLPNSPFFEGGSVNPVAAAYSPFVIRLHRDDATQQFSKVSLTPPPGFTAKLAGIPYCSDQALATAAGKSGNAEKASPSCSDSSRIGTVNVAAGAGPQPYWTQGTAYLTGPYKGAPLSMAIITPAAAGPYDLGTVVTRVALHVDPVTTQVSADADPVPSILEGIPLDIRTVNVRLDRDRFAKNGTSCEPMSLNGQLLSTLGQGAALSNRFQLGDCASLDFEPKLIIRLKGKVKRGGNPALTATLTAKQGEANIAAASVALPHSEFLDQAHIRTICTRVQFAAAGGHGEACPKGSIYGRARAITPLLDDPLEGPVFMRSSSHPLPDLVAALNGQIDVVLAGRIDSHKGGIRNTYDVVPDAPVSKFVLEMRGGRKGLLENSTNICRGKHRATVRFTGHNGAVAKSRPIVKATKCPRKRKRGAHKRGGARKGGAKKAQRG